MATGWITDGGERYYLNTDGSMVKNAWINQDGQKHFVGADGKEEKGWVSISGNIIFLQKRAL